MSNDFFFFFNITKIKFPLETKKKKNSRQKVCTISSPSHSVCIRVRAIVSSAAGLPVGCADGEGELKSSSKGVARGCAWSNSGCALVNGARLSGRRRAQCDSYRARTACSTRQRSIEHMRPGTRLVILFPRSQISKTCCCC